MFKKIEALSREEHQELRFAQTSNFDFAKEALNAPLSASEFPVAARFYPIVFPVDGAAPMVLFALNQQANLYVGEDGIWKAPYVPAHIRRYPFILANLQTQEGEENTHALCVDTQAPHFASGQGDPLFTANGDPADITQDAMKFLNGFQAELNVTQTICQELEEQEVLVEKQVEIEKGGQKGAIGGFRCVDLEKLNALDDAVLAKWVRNGLIRLINAHIDSLTHLKALVS